MDLRGRLNGRTVLVTGAGRGLGAAFVEVCLDAGAVRVYAGVRDLDDVTASDRVVPVLLDVTVPEQVAAAASACRDVDLLVSNAGVSCYGPALDPTEELRAAFEVNVFGPLQLVQAFAPVLRERAGGVITVLSVAAVGLSRSSPGYSATKAAALVLAQGVRAELAESGATVTVSLPGFIDTEMSRPLQAAKASPRSVAERSLEGWLEGQRTVWPDRFAELVHHVLVERPGQLLDDPVSAMASVHLAFAGDPAAGT